MNISSTTVDGVLNHRIKLEQPATGYRVAIDTVLVAAAVPAISGDRVLDMGCGVGGALLCLGCRVPGLLGHGIEIQKTLVELCQRNFERNHYARDFTVEEGDITKESEDHLATFDHAVMNPPYYEEESHDVSFNLMKRTATTENAQNLTKWVKTAERVLKPSGTLTLIHRGIREDEILGLLKNAFGELEILRLLTHKEGVAKRVIIRARKGALASVHVFEPIILHQEGGGYTEEIEKVLRQAEPLVFQSP